LNMFEFNPIEDLKFFPSHQTHRFIFQLKKMQIF
jgi:hypothetical protein